MKRTMQRLLVGLLLLLPATAAFGQSQTVRQSGSITVRHGACFTSNGIIQDCGSAAVPFLSSIGTLGQGPTICANSAASTGPYNQLCLAANTASNAQIILQNYGGATAESLDFVINGVVTTITGSSGGVAGDMACFLTEGSITTCGLAAASGVVTSGAWHASPIALLYGGTGATAASGARTNLGLGTMATQDASAVAIAGGTISGMPTPSGSTDVANKSYVDGLASGLTILAQSTLATATVLPNSPTYANGTLGVGATLTAGSNTTLTVDGTAAPLNTVVLVKNQAAAAQNGIYKVTTAGDGSNPWVLTRATYFDQAAEMTAGSYTFITSGATNINSSWTLATTVATVGSSAVNFNQFSSFGTGITSITPSNGLVSSITASCSQSAITTTGTLSAAECVNAQTGTTYAIADGDRAKLVTAFNAAAQAYSIAQAGAASAFVAGWYVDITNISTNPLGIVTITPTTSTINGAATFTLGSGQSVRIVSDGSNYQTALPSGIRVIKVTKFSSTTTYTPSVGMLYATLECWGGGGGGGGVSPAGGNLVGAGGGAAGNYARVVVTAAQVGGSKTVTIGAAGAAGAAGSSMGGSGGQTSIGTLCVANGGGGGVYFGPGGIPGDIGTGDINQANGMRGYQGMDLFATGSALSGAGGSSLVGAGGGPVQVNDGQATAGSSGSGNASGGSGAAGNDVGGSDRNGGAGTAGYAIVTEYMTQ